MPPPTTSTNARKSARTYSLRRTKTEPTPQRQTPAAPVASTPTRKGRPVSHVIISAMAGLGQFYTTFPVAKTVKEDYCWQCSQSPQPHGGSSSSGSSTTAGGEVGTKPKVAQATPTTTNEDTARKELEAKEKTHKVRKNKSTWKFTAWLARLRFGRKKQKEIQSAVQAEEHCDIGRQHHPQTQHPVTRRRDGERRVTLVQLREAERERDSEEEAQRRREAEQQHALAKLCLLEADEDEWEEDDGSEEEEEGEGENAAYVASVAEVRRSRLVSGSEVTLVPVRKE